MSYHCFFSLFSFPRKGESGEASARPNVVWQWEIKKVKINLNKIESSCLPGFRSKVHRTGGTLNNVAVNHEQWGSHL